MTKTYRPVVIMVALFSATFSQAQIGGLTSYNVLNIPGSARVASMGGSYLAAKDGDINLVALNPSLLDSSVHNKLSLSYVDYFAATNFGYASYARSMKNKRWTGAATMQYFNYGEQQELDGLGYEIGRFTAADYALTIGAGYQYDSVWSFGANFKTIYSALASYSSLAIAMDLGATYNKPSSNFTATFLAKNAGLQLITNNGDANEKLPFELQMGFSKKPRHAPFRFSVVLENLQKWNLRYDNPNATIVTDPVTGEVIEEDTWEFGDNLMRHVVLGTEFLITENIAFRVGYNYRRRQELKLPDRPATAGFTLGLGFKVSRFHFAYGRAIYHAAGPANHFTITTDLKTWM